MLPNDSAFLAFEEDAVYVAHDRSREQAVEMAVNMLDELRDCEPRVVHMRPVSGREADEAFCGEFDSGWIECDEDAPGASPMWKVAADA